MHARRNKARPAAHSARGSSVRDEAAPAAALADTVRPWLLAGAAALFVARPLWPSDVATLGGAGIPVAMGWLLLVALWCAAGLRDGRLPVQLRWFDGLLVALVACFVATGSWTAWHGAPRPAVNVVWEWTALAAAFWLVRQLLRRGDEARALVVVMIGLAVAEASYGLEQYFVSLPADRAAFAADPDGVLRSLGLWFPPGSRERYLFEQRLASTEPFGTFELANSLGGFLATWLVVACAAITLRRRAERAGWGMREYVRYLALPLAVTAIPMLATVILCKSRSALLAVTVGLVGLAILHLAGAVASRRTLLISAGVVFLALGGAVLFGAMTGALDVEVISEIPKSFSYRWEYWRASAALLRDHPWSGAGPGNFRDVYTAYKLPEASEEIADPHNFAIEVATSAGWPALVALLGLLGGVGATVVAAGLRRTPADETGEASSSPSGVRPILIGGFAGLIFALLLPWVVGPVIAAPLSLGKFVVGSGALALIVALWRPWIRAGEMRPLVPALGAAALLVNFLAAGGIGFPATAGSLWLLLGLSVGLADLARAPRWLNRPGTIAASLLACAAAVLGYATAYQPVIRAAQAVAQAEAEPAQAEVWLQAASQADPLDEQPWARLTALRFARWQQEPTPGNWESFEQSARHLLMLRPRHSAAWLFVGDCRRSAAQRSGRREDWDAALAAYRRAVELYPNHALRRARLAIALADAGDPAAAEAEAREAVRLDDGTPHVDVKLSDELRQTVERLSGGR